MTDSDRASRAARQIPPGRASAFRAGLVLQILGGAGFLFCFFGFALSGWGAVATHDLSGAGPIPYWIGAAVCMVLLRIGTTLKRAGRFGLTGAGLSIDSEQARKDLEPWARMSGGVVQDALDEAGVRPGRVQVRCRSCKALNDETAAFCSQCGAKL